MSGAVVAVELVVLAVLFEGFFQFVHLVGRRRLVVIAEYAQHGAGQALGEVNRRDGLLRGEGVGGHADAASPEVNGGVEGAGAAGDHVRVPSAGAAAYDADLAVGVRQRVEEGGCAFGVGENAVVGDAALSAGSGRYVVRGSLPEAGEEVGRADDVSVVGEAAGEFPVKLVPARQVVNQYYGREGAWTERPGEVGVNAIAVVSGYGDGFGYHAFVVGGVELIPHSLSSCGRGLSL